MPHITVTKPRVKKLLEEHDSVELSLYDKGKDPDHFMTATMIVDVKSVEDLEKLLPKAYKEFSGHSNFSMAIWQDDDEE